MLYRRASSVEIRVTSRLATFACEKVYIGLHSLPMKRTQILSIRPHHAEPFAVPRLSVAYRQEAGYEHLDYAGDDQMRSFNSATKEVSNFATDQTATKSFKETNYGNAVPLPDKN